MPTDEEAQDAKDALECAIRDYYTAVAPNALLSAWVLVSHKLVDDDNQVGILAPTEQSFVTNRGLLDIALQGDRNEQQAGYFGAEDDDY